MKMKFGTEKMYNPNYSEHVVLWDVILLKNKQDVIIRFLSKNSPLRQGVRLAIDVGRGSLTIIGIKSKELYFGKTQRQKKCYANLSQIPDY